MNDIGTIKAVGHAVVAVLALIFAAAFKRYYMHIYDVGHENIIKSYAIGIAASWCLNFIYNLPGHFGYLVQPCHAIGLSTGSALLLGLVGFNGGKMRFWAIAIISAAIIFSDLKLPIITRTLQNGVIFYGLGATILSFFREMKNESPFAADAGNPTGIPDASQARRVSLAGDLTPLPKTDSDPVNRG